LSVEPALMVMPAPMLGAVIAAQPLPSMVTAWVMVSEGAAWRRDGAGIGVEARRRNEGAGQAAGGLRRRCQSERCGQDRDRQDNMCPGV
jgi:hypothetical protein